MLGAIAGDVIGSVFEWNNVNHCDFPLFTDASRFTDDTVLTVATAEALLDGLEYAPTYRRYYRRFPNAGYGARFAAWARREGAPAYHSYGNGSAMRVSPVAYAKRELAEVLAEACRSAQVTHNHPEGIKGAQAVAAAVYLARTGSDKEAIRREVEERFGYDLDTPLEDIRPDYTFDVTCQGSVPQALRAFLEGESLEDTIRKAISLGGDSDTIACIAGSVAEPYFGGVGAETRAQVCARLPQSSTDVLVRFESRFGSGA